MYKKEVVRPFFGANSYIIPLKNVFLDVKTFRKYIVTSCRLFADKDDRYTIDIRQIHDRYTIDIRQIYDRYTLDYNYDIGNYQLPIKLLP